MKRYIAHISQMIEINLKVREELAKNKGSVPIEMGKAKKTHEQLGYLHSEVLPKFTATMFTAGEIEKNTERYGKYHLKVLIGFGDWIKYKGAKVFDAFSFGDADTEVLSKAIDKAISECQDRGVYVKPPRMNYAD